MKKHLFIYLLILTLTVGISAQNKESRLLDEFADSPCDDLVARLDYFMLELQKNPTSTGYIVSYDGKYKGKSPVLGETAFRSHQMMNFYKSRNYDLKRVMFISGGLRENYTVQLWISPKGSKSPKIESTVNKIKYKKGKPKGVFCEAA